MHIDQLRSYLDDARPRPSAGCGRWALSIVRRGTCQPGQHGHAPADARSAGRPFATSWPSTCRSSSDPGSGAEQPRSLRGRGPQSAVARLAVRARSRGAADPAADLRHQPASQRSAGQRHESYDLLRMTEGQPVAREALVAEFCAEVAALAGDDAAVMAAPAALQAPRNAADLLTATSFAASSSTRSPGRFRIWPTRSSKRPCCAAPASSNGAARPCAGPIGAAGAVRRAGHGQAGRRRAELFQRHRSDLSLRRRRQHRLAAPSSKPANSSTAWPATCVRLLTEPTDLGMAYRVDLRLRPDGQSGPIVTQPRTGHALLRRAGPHLGAAGVRQSPARGRRSRTGAASFSTSSNRGSIAAI